MGSKPKEPKVAAVAAPAQQSSLEIKRAQEDARKELRGRFGYSSTIRNTNPFSGAFGLSSLIG